MSKSGVIIAVDDDQDDKDLLVMLIRDCGYSHMVRWFNNTFDAFDHMKNTDEIMSIIFCDVNMPKRNGLEFKKAIDKDPVLRKKSIPFIFFSTAANQHDVDVAYSEMTCQGFFKKSHCYDENKRNIGLIMEYWTACAHPNMQ
ncbi:MAG TPA: response regulator [Flavobacterium sp.]|jgi:CheY-like chemotaxis protein